MPSTPKTLFILGMHRSGTSVAARISNLLGAELGEGLVPAIAGDNDLGFWELQDVVDLNESLLKHFGIHHLSVGELPKGWENDPSIAHYRASIQDIVSRETSRFAFWGTKDPRICRLFPLWAEAVKNVGREPVILYSVRHPYEVALSLERRNGLPLTTGFLLWLLYNREAEYYSRPYRRFFVYYPDVFENWENIWKEASTRLNFSWSKPLETIREEVNTFLRPELRRNNTGKLSTIEDTLPMAEPIARTFALLESACQTQRCDTATLDTIWRETQSLLEPLQLEYQKHRAQNMLLRRELHTLHHATTLRLARYMGRLLGRK
ncbi:MAG: chromosome segregation protein [Rickettsiales bacterium]|jgi:hypothetical protein|nr:chromosome segregation protein [Rickettsiales bacterium]